MTRLLPISLYLYGLGCVAFSSTIFLNSYLGAFPPEPRIGAGVVIAVAVATTGVTALLIGSFLTLASEAAAQRRGVRA